MATYKVEKLVPRLRIQIRNRHLQMARIQGPLLGRMRTLRSAVTDLIKHERIELSFPRGSEARGYAERLIAEALRNGDCHKPTMELADFWLEDKQLIHKLFKVLVPRYAESDKSYTRIYLAPIRVPERVIQRCILELRGNPFPSVIPQPIKSHYHLHNILLHEAKKEYCGEQSSTDGEDLFPRFKKQQSAEEVDDNLTETFKNIKLNPDVHAKSDT